MSEAGGPGAAVIHRRPREDGGREQRPAARGPPPLPDSMSGGDAPEPKEAEDSAMAAAALRARRRLRRAGPGPA